jgi:tetratricopeptide (TPR) repeat protein
MVGGAAATYYILTKALRGAVGGGLPGHLSSWHYFLTQLRVIVRYVRLIFIPTGLNLDYGLDYFKLPTSPFEPAVIVSVLFLCGLVFIGWTLRREAPVFAFSILWFFITLSPTSSVVSIADVIFEHRLYLPLVGVCMSFPLLVELVYGRVRQRLAVPASAFAYSWLILIALVVGTVQRNYVWGDEVRLWEDVVSKSPHNERGYNALAFAHYKRGDYEQAIVALEKGRDMLPDKFIEFADSLANFYLKARRYDQAVELFKKTTEYFKGDRLALAYNNLGVAYLYKWDDLQGRRAQLTQEQFATEREQILKPAAEAFLKGLEIDRDMPWALDSYVNVSCYWGKGSEVEATALERLKQKEEFDSLYTVGKIAFNNGDYARADQYFERAEKLKDDAKILFFNHGYALDHLKEDDRAIEKYLLAIRLDPIFIEAHHNLGQIYMRRNQYPQATEAFAEVLRQNPKHVSSNLNLAAIYMSQGNNALARHHLATVLEVSPDNQRAATMLQQLAKSYIK